MKHRRMATLVAASLCLWIGTLFAQGTAATPPPVAAFGKVPAITGVVLSPDGQQLAWIDNSGARQFVEVFDLSKNAPVLRLQSADGLKVRSLDWADDETLLVHNSFVHDTPLANETNAPLEWSRIRALNVRTHKSQILLQGKDDFSYVTGARLLALRTATPKKVVMATWGFSETNYRQETGSHLAGGRKDAGWTFNLFQVDTTTGAGRLLSGGTPYTDDWIVDRDGQPVARSEWEPQRQRFSVLLRRGQAWTPIYKLETGERPVLTNLADDGSALLLLGALGRTHKALWRLPLDGSAPQILIEDEQYDITAPLLDSYTRQLHGAWRGGPDPTIHWLDEKANKRFRALLKTFGGSYPIVIGRSADNNRVLVDVATRIKPSTYYLVDYKRGTADIVGEEYPGLATATLGEVQTIFYKARDGYEIPAYLTLPAGVEPKQLALVALPHGGPQSHDLVGFDWMAQFLASRGYAVLQPQFRGSTGLGEAHAQAGYRQWGGLMQDDVTDGVKAMVEQGVADPRRVCIVGGSYGGYAALAGAAFTPELYACAISINGVSDLPLMLRYEKLSNGSESNTVAYWAQHIGSHTDPNVSAKSPARAVDGVRAPILLLHGSNDSVVPLLQAQTMVKALRARNKPFEFVELRGEDHWLSLSETRLLVLTEMEKFLAEHLTAKSQSGG